MYVEIYYALGKPVELSIATFPHSAIGRRSVKAMKKRGEFLSNGLRWRMCELLHDISKFIWKLIVLMTGKIPLTGNIVTLVQLFGKMRIYPNVLYIVITLDKQTVFSLA